MRRCSPLTPPVGLSPPSRSLVLPPVATKPRRSAAAFEVGEVCLEAEGCREALRRGVVEEGGVLVALLWGGELPAV